MTEASTLRADVCGLWDFFQAYAELEGIRMTVQGCHHEICDLVEAAVCGDMAGYEYFLINMPPRTAKTRVFVAAPAWCFGEFPEAQILYGSYVDKLIHRTVGEVDGVMSKQWYMDTYGDLVLGKKADTITTVKNGCLYAAGVTATITGYGAGSKEPAGGFIAIDDVIKPDEALSKNAADAINQNLETTWKTRRNSDRWTPIFVIMHRLGEDLCHYIKTTYPNKTYVLKFPCFVGGASQFPDTWSDSTQEDLKKTPVGRFVLATQFQQEEASLGGNLIKTEFFGRYSEDPAVLQWEKKIMTCDTGLSSKESADHSVVQCWGKRANRFYLIDMIRGQWDAPQLLANVGTFWKKHHMPNSPVRRLIIEEKAAGPGLLQSLRQLGVPVHGVVPLKDKVQRVQDVLTWHENGFVLIPPDTRAPWVKDFLAECAAFRADGKAAHDDMVDCYAYALQELGGRVSWLDNLFSKPQPV